MGQILLMKIFSNFKRCCFLSIFKIIQKKLQDRFSAAQPLWGGRRGRVSKPLATNLCHLITSFIIFRFSFGFISSKTRRRAKSGGRARACSAKFVNFAIPQVNHQDVGGATATMLAILRLGAGAEIQPSGGRQVRDRRPTG